MLKERNRGINDLRRAPKTHIYTRAKFLLLFNLQDFQISTKKFHLLNDTHFQVTSIIRLFNFLPNTNYWAAELKKCPCGLRSGPTRK